MVLGQYTFALRAVDDCEANTVSNHVVRGLYEVRQARTRHSPCIRACLNSLHIINHMLPTATHSALILRHVDHQIWTTERATQHRNRCRNSKVFVRWRRANMVWRRWSLPRNLKICRFRSIRMSCNTKTRFSGEGLCRNR